MLCWHGALMTDLLTVNVGTPTGDSIEDFRAAVAAGWWLDEDCWWVRNLRDDDKSIDECHFGFTTRDFPEDDTGRNCVFVRSAKYALSYDRGVIAREA